MAVLKKVKSSTLMETLVATVLLIVIFMVTSLTVNNIFGNTITYDTQVAVARLNELEYQYQNRHIQAPYAERYYDWEIDISTHMQYNTACVTLEATHSQTRKTIAKTIIAHAKTP